MERANSAKIARARIPFSISSASYHSREERSSYVAHKFATILRSPILDVGCFNRTLRKELPQEVEYIGVDLMGEPDIRIDLEKERLPFADGEFATVVCTDVLEHLENVHAVFDELCRVSRGNIIISLPNCWHGMWRMLAARHAYTSGKYYGLPAERPADRHRWFFSANEAMDFLQNRARLNGMELRHCEVIVPYGWAKRGLSKLFFGANHINIAAASVWAVIGVVGD
jgi:SAM-dependent methyltransferase